MAIAVASGIIMLALFDRAVRSERIATAQLAAKFELFTIRDDLRRMERHGSVRADRWFSYMDTTLTRAAASIEGMTIWHAMAYLMVSNTMRQIEQAERNRAAAMVDQPLLAEIYSRYASCVSKLLRQRHLLLWRVLGLVARGATAVATWRGKILKALVGSPETSTLLDYACRA
jgi:hypothetical protein